MKKLIAISAVFALVAVGAFAQGFNVGGGTILSADLIHGDNGDDSEIMSSGSAVVRLQAAGSASTGIGDFGAWVRLQNNGWMGWNGVLNGHAWWAPAEVFRLTMGTHPGGWMDMSGRGRWGFHRMPNDVFSPGFGIAGSYAGGAPGWLINSVFTPGGWNEGNFASLEPFMWGGSFNNSFYQGHHSGMMFEINPTPDTNLVNIRLNLPLGFGQDGYGLDNGTEIADVFAAIHAQVQVNLHGTGTLGFTYRGSGTDGPWQNNETLMTAWRPTEEFSDGGSIFAYFGLSAIDNLGLDFGVGFHLLASPVIGIGLAADIGISPEFNFLARVHAELDTSDYAITPFSLMFEISPSFAITPNVLAFFNAGIALSSHHEDIEDNSLGFHIGPYVQFGSTWGPSFYAGFELVSTSIQGADAGITWRVPVGLQLLVW